MGHQGHLPKFSPCFAPKPLPRPLPRNNPPTPDPDPPTSPLGVFQVKKVFWAGFRPAGQNRMGGGSQEEGRWLPPAAAEPNQIPWFQKKNGSGWGRPTNGPPPSVTDHTEPRQNVVSGSDNNKLAIGVGVPGVRAGRRPRWMMGVGAPCSAHSPWATSSRISAEPQQRRLHRINEEYASPVGKPRPIWCGERRGPYHRFNE